MAEKLPGLTEGRMVHFVLKNGEHRAAVVVRVCPDEWGYPPGAVQLEVFLDGTNDQIDSGGTLLGPGRMWATSVQYSETKEPRTWHWIEKAYHMIATIKIGGQVYKVTEVEGLQTVQGDKVVDLIGQVVYEQCAINIEQDIAEPMKAVVLWHEIAHAMLFQAGYFDHTEAQVEALGYGIAQVIRENPELVMLTRGETLEDFAEQIYSNVAKAIQAANQSQSTTTKADQ